MNDFKAREEGAVAELSGNGDRINAPYEGETYYGLPAVKRSTYNWMIGASYFSIGLAGSSQMLSALLDLSDLPDKEPMVRAGRYAALAGSIITPALYTVDLGVSRKWYNMLRIARPTSLMSMGGAWALTDFGVSCGFTVLGQTLADLGFTKLGNVLARTASVSGIPVAAFMSVYMGTELEETSTPLWAEVTPMLAPLFGLSNASNAFALFELAGDFSHTSEETERPVRLLAMLTEAAAVMQLRRIEKRWTEPSRASALYRTRYDLLYRTGLITLGKLAGLIIRAAAGLGGARWRGLRPIASIATLASGYMLPTVLLYQGNKSAERPEDYFEYTSPRPVAQVPDSIRQERGRPGPPRPLSIGKWLAIAGLALGAAVFVLAPRKAY